MSEDGDKTARRVLMLETDERSGLVAAVAACCAENGVSLEITTGPAHVLVTFTAEDSRVQQLSTALGKVGGVTAVHAYKVLSAA